MEIASKRARCYNEQTHIRLYFGAGRDALANFSQELPSARGIATLLARHKTGFRLALGDDVRDKIIEQSLHARARGAEHAEQRFYAVSRHNDQEWFLI